MVRFRCFSTELVERDTPTTSRLCFEMLLERSNYPRLNKRHIRRAIFVEHGRFEDFYRIRSSSRRFLELEKAIAGPRIRDSRIENDVSYFSTYRK